MVEAIKRILVVDGEKEFANTVTRHLKREKFMMHSAHNGEDAREKIDKTNGPGSQYDLVITDVIMPKVSGIELVQWIKAHHSKISVLVVSGLGDSSAAMEAIRPEMDDYCQKPITPREMMRLVNNIDKKRKAHYLNHS
ncbi:MAG: response regulator [Desulfobacteraceae bacterium]|jgi:DNA-binding response OmpR family regulator